MKWKEILQLATWTAGIRECMSGFRGVTLNMTIVGTAPTIFPSHEQF